MELDQQALQMLVEFGVTDQVLLLVRIMCQIEKQVWFPGSCFDGQFESSIPHHAPLPAPDTLLCEYRLIGEFTPLQAR